MLSNTNTKLKSLINEWYFTPLFIVAITIFSLIVTPGYQVFVADQPVFLPSLFNKLDQSLFQNDLVWYKIQFAESTLFIDFLAFFIKLGVDIFWLLFILSAISRALFFVALFLLAKHFTQDRSYALFSLIFFIVAFIVPGVGSSTVEGAFSYRSITLPLGLFSLLFLFSGWRILSIATLFLTYALHPFTAFPFLLFYCIATAFEKLSLVKKILFIILPLIFIGAFIFLRQDDAAGNFFLFMDSEWKELSKFRLPSAFFAFWNKEAYISIACWTLLSTILLSSLKKIVHEERNRFYLYTLIAIPFFLLIVAAIGEFILLHSIIRLQLQRSLIVMVIFVALLIGKFTLWHSENKRGHVMENSLLWAILLWFTLKESFVFLREPFVLFVPALAVLFCCSKYSWFNKKRKFIIVAATLIFLSGYLLAVSKALSYKDISALVFFHAISIGGATIAIMYNRAKLSSSSINIYSVTLILPVFLFSPIFYLSNFTIYPYFYQNTPYMEACNWVQTNTDKTSVFILEPFSFETGEPTEFRLACFRPIFTTLKDAAPPYEPMRSIAFDWKRRQDLVRELRKDITTLNIIQKEYKVDYIFSERKFQLDKDIVFQNNEIFIYKL